MQVGVTLGLQTTEGAFNHTYQYQETVLFFRHKMAAKGKRLFRVHDPRFPHFLFHIYSPTLFVKRQFLQPPTSLSLVFEPDRILPFRLNSRMWYLGLRQRNPSVPGTRVIRLLR